MRSGCGVAAGGDAWMATPRAAPTPRAGEYGPCRAQPGAGALWPLLLPGAGAQSPPRRPWAPSVRRGQPGRSSRLGPWPAPVPPPHPALFWLPQRPPPLHSVITIPEPPSPGAPAPRRPSSLASPRPPHCIPRSPPCNVSLLPAAVPGSQEPKRSSAGRCRRPGALATCRGAAPARPAQPRSLAEERPRGPARPARGALPTGSFALGASSRLRTCRPPPLPRPPGFPLSRLPRPLRVAGFPHPLVPARRPSRPQVRPAPPSPTPASFPPVPALSPHFGVPNPTPVAAFRWGPTLRGSHVGGSETREGARSPPTGGDAWAGGGREGAAKPLGSFGRSRRTWVEKHKWVVWGWWFFPGPITASSCSWAPPSPQGRGHSLGGLSPRSQSRGRHSHSVRGPRLLYLEDEGRGGDSGFTESHRAPREPRGAPGPFCGEQLLFFSTVPRG